MLLLLYIFFLIRRSCLYFLFGSTRTYINREIQFSILYSIQVKNNSS